MTTKDYKIVAATVAQVIAEEPEFTDAMTLFVERFTTAAIEDNPRFSRTTFEIAALGE